MAAQIRLEYQVPGDDFARAGEASADLKARLKQLGLDSQAIRRTAIALYEGEINMAIHANGGQITVEVFPQCVELTLQDHGPGIENIELAMKEGYSTAPDEVRSLGFGAGMGLPNMRNNADDFEIESEKGKGTRVFMRVKV